MVLPSDSNPVMFNLDVRRKTELLNFFSKKWTCCNCSFEEAQVVQNYTQEKASQN
jgi:hypothetical protein